MNEAKTDVSQLPINQVLCGDCVEVMKTFPDEAIDLTMFSPPYYGLRDYGISGQIGLEDHPSKYIEKMVDVCREVKRLLKKPGSMYIVLGDTYYGSGKGYGSDTPCKNLPEPECHPRLSQNNRTNWLQPKQLLGIPWRVAIALQEDGWILRNDIIWNKPNHMPSSVKDRLTNAYEHIFHFVKNRKYYYDLDVIRERHTCNHAAGNKKKDRVSKLMSRNPAQNCFHPAGKNPGDVFQTQKEPYIGNNPHRMRLEVDQHIALDPSSPMDLSHPLGKNPGDVLKTVRKEDVFAGEDKNAQPNGRSHFGIGSVISDRYKNSMVRGNTLGKNPADFWNITTQPFKGAHFAVYPEDVCIRPILSSCPEWICRKCGKPRTRITKTIEIKPRIINGEESHLQYSSGTEGFVQTGSRMGDSIHETLGWSDCGCSAGFDSGIVLDLMCGSGTTLAVAKKLGRKFIGIELNPAYIEIVNKRLAAIPEKITTFF